jgi:hypothetical protein
MSGTVIGPDARAVVLEAIRDRVCSVCRKPGTDGVCRLSEHERCSIERFLPELVAVAAQARTGSFEAYVDALRSTVCRACREGGERWCEVRDGDACMLERYFPLIIEAIERARLPVV